jgi:hypothetical protein
MPDPTPTARRATDEEVERLREYAGKIEWSGLHYPVACVGALLARLDAAEAERDALRPKVEQFSAFVEALLALEPHGDAPHPTTEALLDKVQELGRLRAERDAALAQLNDWKGRAEAHKKKWWDYEQEYILPAFEWAEECGIDLRAAVSANPGKNCVRLLHEAVCERLDAALAREARLAGALRGAMQFFRYDQFDSWNDYNDARGAAQAALAEHDAAKESDHA